MKHRAPLSLRIFVGLFGLAAILANVALLLSDRAPGALRTIFGDAAQRLSGRLDSEGRAGAALGARNVGSDSVVHFGLWAVVAVLVGVALWSWIGLATSALVVSAGSLLIEVAQGRYSSTRRVQGMDALSNVLGVAAGTAVVAVLYLTYSAIAGLATTPDRRPVS